jgi:hypothetical protein
MGMRRSNDWRRQPGLMALALIMVFTLAAAPLSMSASAALGQDSGQDKKSKKSKKKNSETTSTTASSTEEDNKASTESSSDKKKQADSSESESGSETKSKKGGKGKKGSGKAAAAIPTGQAILWKGHPDVRQVNLYWGVGSETGVPKAPFTFVKEDVTGTNPKVKVVDANGVKWNVKFDEEVHAEVAASRLVWACGYMVEASYFVPSGKIIGVKGLNRAKNFVRADGSFTNAMFENRPETIARRNIRWTWDSNPFVGTKEFSGLAILNVLLNNWDAKVDNNNVLGILGEDNQVYEWYVQSDWGGTFGKMGGVFSHTKWDVNDYSKQAFISGVSGGKLQLNYSGKMGSSLKSVPIEHARWFAGIIGQLTDEQIRDAFKAAGATDQEVSGFSARIRHKINELKAAAGR